ncbi:Uncharacterised protein [Yersinia enterocolitica]|uniref:Membrane protein n=1 Tax=Yersinia enterocolitica serotype O:8 / biotype 1B (strain NCTC 13174 / 8081) TaxID=393305 RepID=A1JKK0_YERE8|nr:hypothetical protein [Yersinia enterocolitica]AJI84757.1 hypothetical protein CH47_429 [Yersinia enterocolitica]AJJ24922.1 hypothetical protein CH49_440 [Yersinia enterocolitica]EKA26827.1 hypothetical protein YWA314_12376 [Yersinia enterocolitica subsp. enterocolitica WA-314]ELI8285072.1 hypothetical protein [Yersinia enterocolitica]KGA72073.1 hypothetical protein DJ59_1548 [Yersinia enterocolitica]
MIDEGKILSRHELRTKNSKLTIGIIIFSLGLSFVIISLSLTTAIFSTPSILSILCVAIAGISLSLLLYSRQYDNPIFTYFLYEKGVRVFNHHTGNVYFISFNKIEYIYKYHAGINPNGKINAMAFRTSKNQPWNIIINNITNAYPLMNTIIHQQVMNVGLTSLNGLSRGKTIVFDIVRGNDIWLKLLIFNFIKIKKIQIDTIPLSLSAHSLVTTKGTINIEDIQRIETLREAQHDKIRLFDAKGNVLFSIDYSSLISADLFIALLEHMIQNRIPAYYG